MSVDRIEEKRAGKGKGEERCSSPPFYYLPDEETEAMGGWFSLGPSSGSEGRCRSSRP